MVQGVEVTPEEVNVIHATIKLLALPRVYFDNEVLERRELWLHGELLWCVPWKRMMGNVVLPHGFNPWIRHADGKVEAFF